MRPWSHRLARRLAFEAAITEELESRQNLLPPAPGLQNLMGSEEQLSGWLRVRLQEGWVVAPQQVVAVRKPGHGMRPVPIVGIGERIIYRALSRDLLREGPEYDRSARAYLSFVQAPVLWSHDAPTPESHVRVQMMRVFDSPIRYVVKADISAFYQYIDHELLSSELINNGADFEGVEALREFLGELVQRSFGLPQLLDPSDWLSDVYADLIERDMLRRGFSVWRFNDDFRIATLNYPDALGAIEALDDSCRQLGLVPNEYKTSITKFINYALDTMGLETDDEIPEEDLTDVEGIVADYTESDESENAENSLALIQSAESRDSDFEAVLPDDDSSSQIALVLQKLTVDDLRRLRRALRAVERAGNSNAIEATLPLVIFAPSLMQPIATYLLALSSAEEARVREVVRQILTQVSLSNWQAMWVLRLATATGLLIEDDDIADRVRGWRAFAPPSLRAEICLALSGAGRVGLEEAEHGLRFEPAALRPWYLASVLALRGQQPDSVRDQYLNALRREDRLSDLLLAAGS